MKRIRIVGLCLVAVFALSAMAASGAQAGTYKWCKAAKKGEYTTSTCSTKSAKAHKGKFEIQEVQACAPAKKGEYTDSACTVKSAKAKKGKFEKTSGRKSTSVGGLATLRTPAFGTNNVTCTASSTVGEITGPKTNKERTTFTGCKFAGLSCESAGPNSTPSGKPETIVTNLLNTKLVDHGEKAGGYKHEEPATGEAWNEFSSAEHQPYSSEFNCAGVVFLRTLGTLSGVVSPVNVISNTSKTAFTEKGGEQALLTEALNEKGEWVPPGGAPSFEETEATTTTEAEIEVAT
jgi:hypothetical protein